MSRKQTVKQIDELDKEDRLIRTTDSGSRPKNAIQSCGQLMSIFERVDKADETRQGNRSRIRGIANGVPPFSRKKLEKQGRKNDININFREFESAIEANVSSTNELLLENGSLIVVKIQDKVLRNKSLYQGFEGIIEEEYTDVIRNWFGFFCHIDNAIRSCLMFDVGCMIFPDYYGWQPKAYDRSKIRFDGSCDVDIDALSFICVEGKLKPSDLYYQYENTDKQKTGWIKEGIKSILKECYSKTGKSQEEDAKTQAGRFEAVEKIIRSGGNDSDVSDLRDVEVLYCFVLESDQSVSEYIIPDPRVYKRSDNEYFINKSEFRFKKMQEVVWLMPYNYGDGTYDGIKALGYRIFPHFSLSNIFLCEIFQAARIAGSLIVQPNTALEKGKMNFSHFGGYTLVDPGLNIIQSSFSPPLEPLMQLRSMSEAIVNNNIGIFKPRQENPMARQATKTATQVQAEESKEARFEKNQAKMRYDSHDLLQAEMFRRMTNPDYLFFEVKDIVDLDRRFIEFDRLIATKGSLRKFLESNEYTKMPGREEALKFFYACYERGVPPQLLYDSVWMLKVKCSRGVGAGSATLKRAALAELIGLRGETDEIGRKRIIREYVAALLGGYSEVDKYFPLDSRDVIPSNQTSIAMLENNDIMEGQQCAVGSDQLHALHIDVVMTMLMQVAKEFAEQQRDPAEVYQIMAVGIPHAGEHLQYLAKDPTRKELVEAASEQLKMLGQVAQQAQQMAMQQQQQQQQQEEQNQQTVQEAQQQMASQELQAKMYDSDNKAKVALYEADKLHEARMRKVATSEMAMNAKTRTEIQMLVEQTYNKLNMDRLKTESKIANDAKGKQGQ